MHCAKKFSGNCFGSINLTPLFHNGDGIIILRTINFPSKALALLIVLFDFESRNSPSKLNLRRGLHPYSYPENYKQTCIIIIFYSFSHQMKLVVNESDVIGSEMQSVQWAGTTNNIIFVKDNDIYIKYDLGRGQVRITSDGKPGFIYNGIPDWLYQGKFDFFFFYLGTISTYSHVLILGRFCAMRRRLLRNFFANLKAVKVRVVMYHFHFFPPPPQKKRNKGKRA